MAESHAAVSIPIYGLLPDLRAGDGAVASSTVCVHPSNAVRDSCAITRVPCVLAVYPSVQYLQCVRFASAATVQYRCIEHRLVQKLPLQACMLSPMLAAF